MSQTTSTTVPTAYCLLLTAYCLLPPMLHVVLLEPETPPNTGNIGRLCLATGARLHLVGPLGFSLEDKALRRAGLDYWHQVDVHRWDSFPALQSAAASTARFWYLTTKTDRPYWSQSFAD